jgi:hypothetical protein
MIVFNVKNTDPVKLRRVTEGIPYRIRRGYFYTCPAFYFHGRIEYVAPKMCIMESNKNNLSIEGVKDLDMVGYLSSLGYEPVKIRRADYWYLSPLRQERTASFKVNRVLNRWYDHGIGKGGNIIDFGILHYNCTPSEFLNAVRGNNFLPAANDFKQQSHERETASRVIVNDVFPVRSKALISYLGTRKITLEIATVFCSEVSFSLYGKSYFAIGFKNDFGGYELRNRFFKGSSSPKGFTTVKNGHQKLSVFEGFFDLLSYKVLEAKGQVPLTDFLILNSLSFFDAARPVMEGYRKAMLYLDNDTAGQNRSAAALKLSDVYEDGSRLFSGFSDLNQCLVKGFNNSVKKECNGLSDELPQPEKKRFHRRI